VYAAGHDYEEEKEEQKSKFSQNTTNLLSIRVATCFDSRNYHQAN